MRKLLFLTSLLIALSFSTELRAQSKKVFLHTQETMDALSLNQEQQAKIKKLTSDSFVDIGKFKKDASLSEFDRKSKIYGVYRNREAEYKKTLTDSQWEKFLEMKEAAKKSN